MRASILRTLLVSILLTTFELPAVAHHSLSAEFDADDKKLFVVEGVISSVRWVNPHIFWTVDAIENGKPVTWTFTNFPPAWWHRYGISKDVFKVGDKMTVEAWPPKDGTPHFGYGKVVHFANGRTISTLKGDPTQAQ
jgi:hypothetical protein